MYIKYNYYKCLFFSSVRKSGKPSLKLKKRNSSIRMLKMENSGELTKSTSKHILIMNYETDIDSVVDETSSVHDRP